eukprot:scaffold120545_cov27-Attheya_sp.AAC.1
MKVSERSELVHTKHGRPQTAGREDTQIPKKKERGEDETMGKDIGRTLTNTQLLGICSIIFRSIK